VQSSRSALIINLIFILIKFEMKPNQEEVNMQGNIRCRTALETLHFKSNGVETNKPKCKAEETIYSFVNFNYINFNWMK